MHIFLSVSKDWHHAGKDKGLRCTECRLHFKRYGEERPLDSPKENPSFLFKPVKEEDSLSGKQDMRTRQTRDSVSLTKFEHCFHVINRNWSKGNETEIKNRLPILATVHTTVDFYAPFMSIMFSGQRKNWEWNWGVCQGDNNLTKITA